MTSNIELVPADRARHYECFNEDCRCVIAAPFSLDSCPDCGEQRKFHLMD